MGNNKMRGLAESSIRFGLCVQNKQCRALEQRKVYRLLPDQNASRNHQVRVVDDSGEAHLCPKDYFVPVELSPAAKAAFVFNTTFVLGVDLDGVIADFYGGLRHVAAEWLERKRLAKRVSYGFPEWNLQSAPGGYDALHKFAVTQRELFLNLRPIPGAATAVRRLSDLDIRIRIITHRLFIKYFHETAVRQTVEWLDRYDVPYWDLCFMKDKAAVGADLYVEDSPSNVRALREDGHPTIVFRNSTNLNLKPPRADTWDEVEALVLEAIEHRRLGSSMKKKSLSGV